MRYTDYFKDWEVKPEFKKEFISLWPGWLGKENYHKLDKVTEAEWARFNNLIRLISSDHDVSLVSQKTQSLIPLQNIEAVLSSYSESMEKDQSSFLKVAIPSLKCLITEEWD